MTVPVCPQHFPEVFILLLISFSIGSSFCTESENHCFTSWENLYCGTTYLAPWEKAMSCSWELIFNGVNATKEPDITFITAIRWWYSRKTRKAAENWSSLSNPEKHRGIFSTEKCCLDENDGMFFRPAFKKLNWKLNKAASIICNEELKWEAKTSSFVFHGGKIHLLQNLY